MSTASLPAALPSAATMLAAINLNTTIGALLIGGLISAILYGITSTQAVVYYQREHGDPRYIKLAVSVLWILDTFDMCLIFHILYWYLITNYGNAVSLADPVWSIILHVMVTSATQTIVRGMFAVRVWRLSHGNAGPVITIGIVTITDLVCSIVITVKAFHTTFAGLKKLDPLVYLEFASGFAGDFLVALCLCYFLHRSRTGFGKTESIINVLMSYVVNTGLFTAITSSVSLVLFAVQPDNFTYAAVYLQLSKLYVNAYLAMLNARDSIRERSQDAVSIHLSDFSQTRTGPIIHNMTNIPRAHEKNASMSIIVETETDTIDSPSSYRAHPYSKPTA